MITLASHALRVVVRPEIGGSLARCDWIGRGEPVPVMRPWDGSSDDPNRHACYPLVPWSNRISGGGIEVGGRFWPLRPNWAGEPYPIHGDGWQKAWRVARHTQDEVVLTIDSDAQPPFAYRAELAYLLADATLTMRLAVLHCGAEPVPYGLGFHPWLPRTPATVLQMMAAEVWLETPDHLPAGKVPVATRPDWDFAQLRPLPRSWINNTFVGWDRTARVYWPEHRLTLTVGATPELATCILYSPSGDANFFCLEPVSHPVDAHHLPGQPGLKVLPPGERIEVACTFTVDEAPR